jgi:Fic family protein
LYRVLAADIEVEPGGRYRHWDTLRRRKPPEGLTSEEWWYGVRMARTLPSRGLPLVGVDGAPFTFTLTDEVHRYLHRIDRDASGQITVTDPVLNPEGSRRYLVSSLIEEAITSSQLEGANTTRRVAKEMLRTARRPRDKGEQMILNNYAGMELVRRHRDDPLTPELVLAFHEVIVRDTLDPEHAGRLQQPGEARVLVSDMEGGVLHQPPPADQLPERLAAMCDFANGVSSTSGFMHPVVRSILLHFWLAYDHPFLDGNGRTARLLFYWSMLRQRYWLTEYLSISRILRAAPARYGRAFLYTETDGNDTTYFVLHQLDVICRALDDLQDYLRVKMAEIRRAERLIRGSRTFNYRQLALLSHGLRHPDAVYSFASHAASHKVTHESARHDLLDLEGRGLVDRRKLGRKFTFAPASNLEERLAAT